jgi:hypothetical protein
VYFGVIGLVLELQGFKVDLFALKLLSFLGGWIFICLAVFVCFESQEQFSAIWRLSSLPVTGLKFRPMLSAYNL